jgi:hypothetical protein
MVDIDAIARSASALQALMVFDSCFSGNIFVNRGPVTSVPLSNQNIGDFLRKPVRSYITAGGPNQEVPANSPIATLLLRGIQGDADKYHSGFVTATDLGIYLRNTAPSMTGNLITPQFGKSPSAAFSGGEFVFLELPTMAGLAPGAVAKSPPPRSDVYLIFFDWDKYNITPEGERVLELAAQQWKVRGGRMKVTGYTDTVHPPDESQRLSEREADSVSSRLRALGVPQDAMVVSARGQNDNRVPTGPGVREPQNRRVEIVLE